MASSQLALCGPAFIRRCSELSGRRRLCVLAVAAVSVGAFSLAAGHALAYDPTVWQIWAVQLTHGTLHTAGAAIAWKPLPVLIDAPFAAVAPVVSVLAWLVVARAAALVAVVIGWRLGRRVGGPLGAVGAAAVVAFVIAGRFAGTVAGGMAEPVSAAAMLVAADATLRRRWPHVLAALIVASLVRPEAWPFLVVAAVATVAAARKRLVAAVATVATVLLVPLAWFVPDWVAAGDPLRSLHRDAAATTGGPLRTAHPVVTMATQAWHALPSTCWIAAVVTVGAALVARRRGAVVTTAAGVAWIAIEALAVARGSSSGDTRYLLPGLVLIAASAGAAAGAICTTLSSRFHAAADLWADRRRAVTAVCMATTGAVALVILETSPVTDIRAAQAAWQWERVQTAALHPLDALTDSSAFAAAASRCGRLVTGPYQVPLVAFVTGAPLNEVIQARSTAGPRALLLTEASTATQIPAGYRPVRSAGTGAAAWTWWSTSHCQKRGALAALP